MFWGFFGGLFHHHPTPPSFLLPQLQQSIHRNKCPGNECESLQYTEAQLPSILKVGQKAKKVKVDIPDTTRILLKQWHLQPPTKLKYSPQL